MSGYANKWIVLVILPLLVALYLSYPPFGVTVQRKIIAKRTAQTPEQASAQRVKVGEQYVVKQETERLRWLPLAMGQRDESSRIIERREDGTIVEERTVRVRGRIKLGLDIAGGTELLYQLKPREGERITGELGQTIGILKDRIDPANVKEFRIQAAGRDRVLIQVPQASATEVGQLKRRLEKMGRLEFKLAAPREGKYLRLYDEAKEGKTPDEYVKMYVDDDPSKTVFLVKKGEAAITGRYLSRVDPTTDQWGRPAVGFEFDPVGTRFFGQITEENLGWNLGIILDGVLKSAPVIRTRIAGPGIIEGNFTQDEVNDVVNVLRAGSLPLDIQLLEESTVGPQLGRDSIHRGLLALAIAGFLVVGFMGVYYINCGWVADGAVLLNVVLLVGVMSLLGATLTLPGMAGVILTVGMAVDANVLIFERIREEQAAGKSMRMVLRNGYDRAFVTIFDANVTTILAAVILYLVGTGPVRGFAVTLTVGIALSMFTALTLTRLTFDTLLDSGRLKEFRMFSLFSNPHILFASRRKLAYVGSAVVLLVGMTAFALRGSRIYDIDFTGGSLVQVVLAHPTPASEVRSLLAAGGFPDAEVQGIQTADATATGLTHFSIRVKGAGAEEIQTGVLPAAERKLKEAGLPLRDTQPLRVSSDATGLDLSLKESVSETDVRRALAEGGDPYNLGPIGNVSAEAGLTAKEFTVRAYNVSPLLADRALWGMMARAFSFASVERTDCAIREETLEEPAAGSDAGSLQLVLDKPLQWQVLAVELDRRQFPGVDVRPAGSEGTAFVLTGQRAALEQFQREFPAGSTLQGVASVQIDGQTVTATLQNAYSEQDLRAFFERQGLTQVYVVPLDAKSRSFRLSLIHEPVREKMQAIFASLASKGVGVSFANQRSSKEAPNVVLADVKLDAPMALDVVKGHIANANLGPYSEGIIQHEGDYGADVLVSDLTLVLPADKADRMQGMIKASFSEPRAVQGVVSIGATVAEEMQGRALLAVILSWAVMILYLGVRFRALRWGVAAVIALVHDVLITAGMMALADWSGVMGNVKMNLSMLAAFLTIIGYSVNDTIVVFDRIRENMANLGRKTVTADLIDMSVNQTLGRTVLTSATVFMVVVVLYFLGGSVLEGLALALIVGVITGTYSSVFIASPILLDWPALAGGTRALMSLLLLPLRLLFRGVRFALGGSR